MKKKIMILTPALSGGGAEKVAINLANKWVSMKHEVVIVSMKKIDDYRQLVSKEVKVIYLGTTRLRYLIISLRKLVLEIRPSHIVSVIRDSNLALSLCMPFKKRAHWTFREASTMDGVNSKFILYKWLYIFLMRWAYKRVDSLIANSKETLSNLNKHKIYNNDQIVVGNPVIPNEIFNDLNNERNVLNLNGKIILSVGRMHYVKGFDILIKAFSEVIKEENAYLVILGQGPEEKKLKNLCTQLQIVDRVIFKGFVMNPWPFYKEADLFVSSSRWEGFGNAIVESLASGTPVIVSDCPGGPREIINEGEFGDIARVGDHLQLKDLILKNLSKKIDKKIIINRSKKYSVENIINEYNSAIFK